MFKRCIFGRVNKFLFGNVNIFKNSSKLSSSIYKRCNNKSGSSKIGSSRQYSTFKYIQPSNQICKNKYKIFGKVLMMASYCYHVDETENVEGQLEHLLAMVKLALQDKNYEQAEEILKVSMRIAEEHKCYIAWSYICYILALVAINQGHTDKAENLLSNTIEQLVVWGFPDDWHNIIDLKLRLSRLYSDSGKDTLAEIGFETCLYQQQAKMAVSEVTDSERMLYVNILFWYGIHMIRYDKFEEAKEMIEVAHEFASDIPGLPLGQKLLMLYTLADLNAEMGNYDVALKHIRHATVLAKDIASRDLPLCYIKLADICERMGRFQEAKEAYEEALKFATMFGDLSLITEISEAILNLNDKLPK